MATDDESLADYIRRHREAFGVDLTEDQARELSDGLLRLYRSVAIRPQRPSKPDDDAPSAP